MGGRRIILRCELCNREMRGGHKNSPHHICSWCRSRYHKEIALLRDMDQAIAAGGTG